MKPLPTPARWTTLLRCIDPEQQPIAGLKLSFRVTERNNRARLERVVRTGSILTDAEGLASIEGKSGESAFFELASTEHFAKSMTIPFQREGRAVDLTVWRATTVQLHAIFEDGSAFCGTGGLRATGFGVDFKFPEDGRIAVMRVPQMTSTRCILFEYRLGYERFQTELILDDTLAGKVHTLVVPKSVKPKNGLVALTLDGLPGPNGLHFQVIREEGSDSAQRVWVQDGTWSSGLLPAGRYRIAVLGEWAGETEWLQIVGGQVTSARLRLSRSGSVTALIVDDTGNAVVGAVLRRFCGSYMRFGDEPLWAQLGVCTPVDLHGNATLDGLPPGTLQIQVEALGYEIETHTLTLASLENHDLGTIVLRKADGQITVKVKGQRIGLEYAIMVCEPQSGQILPSVPISGTEHTLSGLPIREYDIVVVPLRGGDVASTRVCLTRQQNVAEIEVDVSALEPQPDRSK